MVISRSKNRRWYTITTLSSTLSFIETAHMACVEAKSSWSVPSSHCDYYILPSPVLAVRIHYLLLVCGWLCSSQKIRKNLYASIQCHAFKPLHTKKPWSWGTHKSPWLLACLHNSICCALLQTEIALKDILELVDRVLKQIFFCVNMDYCYTYLTHSTNE